MAPDQTIEHSARAEAMARFRAAWLPPLLTVGSVLILAAFAVKALRRIFGARRENGMPGDFYHFFEAARAAVEGGSLYASGTQQYFYPPLLAVALSPLVGLGMYTSAKIWLAFNVFATALCVILAFFEAAKRFSIPTDALTRAAVVIVALLLSMKYIRWEFALGQTDTVLLLAFVLGLRWMDKRPVLAGVLIGLAANVKYQSLIVVPYLLIRGRYRMAASSCASAVGFALLPAVVLGWGRNLTELREAFSGLLGMLGAIAPGDQSAQIFELTWHRSVSLTSAAARLSETLGLGTGGILLFAGVFGLALLGIGWWIYAANGAALVLGRGVRHDAAGRGPGLTMLEWCGLVVVVLTFGPQTTGRHMFLVLLLNVLIAALLLAPRVGVRRLPLVIGVAIMLLGINLPPGGEGGPFPGAVNAWRAVGGQSWCLLAMYFTMLWVGLRHLRAVREGRPLLSPPPVHPREAPA